MFYVVCYDFFPSYLVLTFIFTNTFRMVLTVWNICMCILLQLFLLLDDIIVYIVIKLA